MNSTNNTACNNSKRLEMITCVLSSAGCSWNTNETDVLDEKPTNTSRISEEIPCLKFTYPSFSLTDDDQNGENEEEDDDTKSSTHRRKLVQSKASKLMCRKRVYSHNKHEDETQKLPHPQRIMLENILDSFDQLVDARIRAYTRILSNHVRALSASNNVRGARVAEYKLQTLLEAAANHLSFDSISTEFRFTSNDSVSIDDSIDESSNTAAEAEKCFSLPIELNVEIRSPRFLYEGIDSKNRDDVPSLPHESHQDSLQFRAEGEVRGHLNFIGRGGVPSNDTDRCSKLQNRGYRNIIDHNPLLRCDIYHEENIEIYIDCNALLSQMIEAASKVVIMAVELTNMAWTNNRERKEEISMDDLIAENSRNVTNIITDDDDDGDGFTANEVVVERTTGKRSRHDMYYETGNHGDTKISKQVSEISFHPNHKVVREDEHIKEQQKTSNLASNNAVTTITNLHLLEEDADRKARYFVSDPSYDSSGSEQDPTAVCEDQKLRSLHESNEDESYNNISAERACHIVDFVLAGEIIPSSFAANKKLRLK
mmetsp:Transcript_3617/g.9503  ORF Transcript_3617/g.9503 Transcript_3617/m.9503 type:complete len:540 (+) Transcript_3617:204-1823(+)